MRSAIARRNIGPYIEKQHPLSPKLKVQLYRAYVLSIVMYAAPSSVSNANINKLQAQENHCLRKILGKKRYETTNENLVQFHLRSQSERIKSTTNKFSNKQQDNTTLHETLGKSTKETLVSKSNIGL